MYIYVLLSIKLDLKYIYCNGMDFIIPNNNY